MAASWPEPGTDIRSAVRSPVFTGLEVTVLNPKLDTNGSATADLVTHLTNALLV